MSADMLTRRLRRRGHDIIHATDGVQAVAMAGAERPDLVLMDMNLPVMDGWDATRRIKTDDSTRSIPVIALTAHALVPERDRALAAGCDDYDTKPVEFERLIGKIETALRGRT